MSDANSAAAAPTAPAPDPLTKPAAQSLLARLRSDIQQARLEPNQRLREVDIAARYGVSRAAAREALRLLHAERIVELRPGQGATVAAVSIFRLYDLIEMRAALFALVARQAAERADDDDLQAVAADLDDMLRRPDAEVGTAAGDPTTAMIDAIAAASRNRRARGLLEQLASRTVWRYAAVRPVVSEAALALWARLRTALVRRQGIHTERLAGEIVRTERSEIMERLLISGSDLPAAER